MRFNRDIYLRGFGLATAALVGAFVGYSVFVPVDTNAAEQATTQVSVDISPTISLSTEGADASGNLPIEVDQVSGTNMGTGEIAVKVSTNDPEGYSLFINTDKADTTLSQNGVTDRILALEGETSVANFPDNSWGYSIDGGSTYFPVQPNTENPAVDPSKMATAPRAKITSAAAANDTTNVTIGAKVKSSLPSGTYGNTVVFTAFPNMDVARIITEQTNP